VRRAWVVAAAMGCAFHRGAALEQGAGDGPRADTAGDSAGDANADASRDAAPGAFCSTDSHLRLCYSFDPNPLPSTYANEGAAVVDAQLTNVTRVTGTNGGGAAQLGNTSEILVAPTTNVTGIHAVELWFRVDTDPAVGSRYGLIDAAGAPNLDMFYYLNATAPLRTIRCGLGSPDDLYTPELGSVAPTPWLYVVCVCETDGTTKMYVDGSLVVSKSEACTGGDIGTYGLTIGQNSNGAAPVDSWLIGAFDGIRLWDQPLPAATICATSGHATCL
jgi:hypothetical protein